MCTSGLQCSQVIVRGSGMLSTLYPCSKLQSVSRLSWSILDRASRGINSTSSGSGGSCWQESQENESWERSLSNPSQLMFRLCWSILDRPSRGISSTSSGLGGSCLQESHQESWERALSDPSQSRRDNRLERKSPHPDFVRKVTRDPLWMNNEQLVDSRLPTLDAQLRSHRRVFEGASGLGFSRLGHELIRLCEEGQLDRALNVLWCMDQQSTAASVTLYSSLLKACARRKALAQARGVHAHLAKNGLETTRFLGEFMVSTLVRCGGLEDALQLFHRLPHRTVFSWTAVISGHIIANQGREALRMYKCMRGEGLDPDKYTFPSLLKACANIPDLEEGRRIHAEALKYRCASDVFVSTCLIDMYANFGCIVEALNVFDGLSQRNVMLWNAMLVAYTQHGQMEKALQLHKNMEEEGVSPNERTLVTAMQACGTLGEKKRHGQKLTRDEYLEKGKRIHAAAERKGYVSKVFVVNNLISMYGKCGSIMDAESVFNPFVDRDVVSWNAMIVVYTQNGQAHEALQLYEKMWEEGITPNDRTLVSGILACTSLAEKDENLVHEQRCKISHLERGKVLHADAQSLGYDSDVFVGNSLISMYGKCGRIVDAWSVFNGLVHQDVVSWNAMLGACTQQGEPEKALQLYIQMQEEGISPDARTFVSTLQACGVIGEKEECGVVAGRFVKVKSLEWGKKIHAEAKGKSLDSHVFVGNTLIRMYGKCGSVVDADDVFDKLFDPDVVSWNSMLTAYAEQGYPEEAFDLYQRMQLEGMTPDVWSFVAALQAAVMLADKEVGVLVAGRLTKMQSLEKGKVLHAHIWKADLLSSNVFIGNTLISLYGKCGSISDAQNVYDELVHRNVVSCNAMLAVYGQQGQAEKALELYERVLREGVSPNDRTFVSILQACGILADNETCVNHELIKETLQKGKAVHADAWRRGSMLDVFVASSLISMYGKCGSIVDAQNVFEKLPQRTLVVWTSMLVSYVEHGLAENALELYEQMQHKGMSPDARTFIGALQACGKLAEKRDGQSQGAIYLEKVEAIYGNAHRKGYDSDVFLAATLITAYSKCGAIVEAQNMFNGMCKQDVALWNAILAAYVEHSQGDKALQMYTQMLKERVHPNEVTALLILQACSNTGSLDTCRQVHHTLEANMNSLSPLLATTLIHAYGKCGSMADAQTVFNALSQPDVVSWNAFISGYARQGNHVASLQCYDTMGQGGIKPDAVTFVLLLSACSHAGLVEKGIEYFDSMSKDHGINPEIEHYVCMIDLFSRAGHFLKVEHMLGTMRVPADLALYVCLLGSCRKHGNIVLARKAFDCAVSLQPKHTAAYMLMSNIYTDAGLWDSANKVDELRQQIGAWKEPGQSWIEHKKDLYSFMVGPR